MLHRLSWSSFAALALLLCACDPPGAAASVPPEPPPAASPTAAPPLAPLRRRPKTDAELPTTSAEIAIGNLDGQVKEADRIWGKVPTVDNCRAAAGAHATHGKRAGDLDEMALGIAIITKCVALDPKDASLHIDRADQLQSLHRFAEARAELAKAKELGAKPEQTAPLEAELDWNDGKYEPAIAAIRAARARHETPMTVAREALLEHDLGHVDESDRLFERAEDLVRDTSPFPVAWLDLQRGIHLERLGRFEEAIPFFRAAIARAPNVAEREHLAECLRFAGKDDEATALYEQIVKGSDDPEFMGALAALYEAHGKAKEATALREKATRRYDELLRKYPDAMYWHASEYFLGEGHDPQKARALLEKNLALRPNAQSLVALARAELATGDVASAAAHVDRALATPVVSAEAHWTAARVACARADLAKCEAEAHAAMQIDPRVDATEPPLSIPRGYR